VHRHLSISITCRTSSAHSSFLLRCLNVQFPFISPASSLLAFDAPSILPHHHARRNRVLVSICIPLRSTLFQSTRIFTFRHVWFAKEPSNRVPEENNMTVPKRTLLFMLIESAIAMPRYQKRKLQKDDALCIVETTSTVLL
jgi:hypothetical protein